MHRSLRVLALAAAAVALSAAAAAQPAVFTPADDARASLTPRQADLLAYIEGDPATAALRLVEAHLDRVIGVARGRDHPPTRPCRAPRE